MHNSHISVCNIENTRIKMRKLALDDEILLNIEKPARYIGNEVNSVMKEKDEIDIRVSGSAFWRRCGEEGRGGRCDRERGRKLYIR